MQKHFIVNIVMVWLAGNRERKCNTSSARAWDDSHTWYLHIPVGSYKLSLCTPG